MKLDDIIGDALGDFFDKVTPAERLKDASRRMSEARDRTKQAIRAALARTIITTVVTCDHCGERSTKKLRWKQP